MNTCPTPSSLCRPPNLHGTCDPLFSAPTRTSWKRPAKSWSKRTFKSKSRVVPTVALLRVPVSLGKTSSTLAVRWWFINHNDTHWLLAHVWTIFVFLAGVIDEDYRGNVGVILYNHSDQDFVVNAGDRVAQLICEKISYPELVELKVIYITEDVPKKGITMLRLPPK